MIFLNKFHIKIIKVSCKNIWLVTILLLTLIAPIHSQQAVITGDTTICDGGLVNIYLSLEGDAPWSVTIELNSSEGVFSYTNDDIYAEDTILKYDKNGDFRIINASDNNGTISFSSTDIVTANKYAPPTEATIGGGASICEESSYNAEIILRGNAPWNLTYSYNGGDPIEVPNILESPYYLNVSNEGTYLLETVTDENCPGTAVGFFTLTHHDKSTAYLVGGEEKCAKETTPLTVIFSGSPPYSLEYMRDGLSDGTIENITNSPFTFKVSEPGEYGIYEFTDNNGCIGTASGSATVANYPPVEIDIINLSSTYALNSNPVDLEATPTGGEFKGDGVITSTSTFYPELAVEYGEMPYEIIYTYQEPITGCIYYDTSVVNIIDSTSSIILPGGRTRYCSNEEPFVVVGANIYYEIGSFTISGDIGLTDHGNDSATIDPTMLGEGNYNITYRYFNGSSFDEFSREIEIEQVEPVSFIELNKTSFCGNDGRITLIGSETDGIFSGSGVEIDTITTPTKYYFNPAKANIGNNNLIFSYITPTGCKSEAVESVVVHDVPKINFTTEDSCVNENSPRPIKFVNQTESEDEIVLWEWNFNDFGSPQNTSNLKNPSHVYETVDDYNVSLKATTIEGCVGEDEKEIVFGESPQSSFVFSSECWDPDTSVLFTQTVISNYDVIDYEWIFIDNVGTEVFHGDSIGYKFSRIDEYLVQLIAKTTQGCVDTFEENIQIKPTSKLSDGSYFQDFEVHNNYWENEFSKVLNNNSWLFGATEGSFTKTANNNAWYTKLEYSGEETSWIKSPCFDFSDVERPLIKFDIWRDFEEVRDGANLQYTLDNGKTWNLVGTVGDGLNWYNSYQINGNPGAFNQGWSDDLKDTKWIEVRHRLDELAGKTNIQFRIVYGSDGTNNENYGIAFDNVRFEERSHVVLLENFTNNSETASLSTDSLINTLRLKNINDLIDIQYHTDFPGTDSLNLVNPLEVNARLLYYGNSSVPLSILDGTNTYDYVNSSVTNTDIIVKSLTESLFEIDFNTTTEGNTLDIDYTIRALESQNNRDFSLYIVILEDFLTQVVNSEEVVFMNTFRKFLPDPGAISLQSDWDRNEKYEGGYSWGIDDDIIKDIENMKVVLFLQDDEDNKVIQAAVNKKLKPVGIKPQKKKHENAIRVYPNLFNDNLRIQRNHIYGSLKIDFFSISGNILFSSVLEETETSLRINSTMPSGLYFIRITAIETGHSETVRVVKY